MPQHFFPRCHLLPKRPTLHYIVPIKTVSSLERRSDINKSRTLAFPECKKKTEKTKQQPSNMLMVGFCSNHWPKSSCWAGATGTVGTAGTFTNEEACHLVSDGKLFVQGGDCKTCKDERRPLFGDYVWGLLLTDSSLAVQRSIANYVSYIYILGINRELKYLK